MNPLFLSLSLNAIAAEARRLEVSREPEHAGQLIEETYDPKTDITLAAYRGPPPENLYTYALILAIVGGILVAIALGTCCGGCIFKFCCKTPYYAQSDVAMDEESDAVWESTAAEGASARRGRAKKGPMIVVGGPPHDNPESAHVMISDEDAGVVWQKRKGKDGHHVLIDSQEGPMKIYTPKMSKQSGWNFPYAETATPRTMDLMNKASTLIQARYRGHSTRQLKKQRTENASAATRIQTIWRGYKTRNAIAEQREEEWAEQTRERLQTLKVNKIKLEVAIEAKVAELCARGDRKALLTNIRRSPKMRQKFSKRLNEAIPIASEEEF